MGAAKDSRRRSDLRQPDRVHGRSTGPTRRGLNVQDYRNQEIVSQEGNSGYRVSDGIRVQHQDLTTDQRQHQNH